MNKLKPGDTIELKTRTVRHFVKHLGYYYIKPHSLEFTTQYASELAMFLGAFLKKANNPSGKIVSYGARIDGTDMNFLMVRVSNKLGKSEVLSLEEKDVTKRN